MAATRYGELERTIDRIELKIDELDKKMKDVLVEIGGAPDSEYRDAERKSIRYRLHQLENVKYAAGAAGAALGLLFGRVMRWAILIGVLVGAIASIVTMLRLLGVGG